MCGAMDRNGSYDFGAAFAQLTGVFEDAAALACEGQAAGLRAEQHVALVEDLDRMTSAAGQLLAELRLELQT